jgi:hypothetical protein
MKLYDPKKLRKMLLDNIQSRKAAIFHLNREIKQLVPFKRIGPHGIGYVEDIYNVTDTVCVVRVPGGYAVGVHLQSPRDTYDRRYGNDHAFEEAMENNLYISPVDLKGLSGRILDALKEQTPKFSLNNYTLSGKNGHTIDESMEWFQNICQRLQLKNRG